jgi:hypothetical protein
MNFDISVNMIPTVAEGSYGFELDLPIPNQEGKILKTVL